MAEQKKTDVDDVLKEYLGGQDVGTQPDEVAPTDEPASVDGVLKEYYGDETVVEEPPVEEPSIEKIDPVQGILDKAKDLYGKAKNFGIEKIDQNIPEAKDVFRSIAEWKKPVSEILTITPGDVSDVSVEAPIESPYRQGKEAADIVRNSIPEEEQFVPESGLAMRVLQQFNQPGNVVRSAIAGAIDPKRDATTQALEAYNKQRETNAQGIYDALIAVRPDLKPYFRKHGTEEGYLEIGDLFDFAKDLPVEIGTDPMMFLGRISKMVEKAAKVPKSIRKLSTPALRAATKVQTAGLDPAQLELIKQAQKAVNIRRGIGLGATGGAVAGAMSDPGAAFLEKPSDLDIDDDIPDLVEDVLRVGTGALGAALLIPKAGGGLKKAAKGSADYLREGYLRARGVTPDVAAKYSSAKETLAAGDEAFRKRYVGLVQSRLEALEGLSVKDRKQFEQIVNQNLDDFVSKRNSILSRSRGYTSREQVISAMEDLMESKTTKEYATKLSSHLANASKIADPKVRNYVEQSLNGLMSPAHSGTGTIKGLKEHTIKSLKEARGEQSVIWNRVTDNIDKIMTDPAFIDNAVKGSPQKVQDAVRQHIQNNQDFIKSINTEVYGQSSGKWGTKTTQHKIGGQTVETLSSEGLPGIAWHNANPDVKHGLASAMNEADEFYKRFSGPKGFSQKLRPDMTDAGKKLEDDARYAIYAHRTANNFRTKEEREAMKVLSTVHDQIRKSGESGAWKNFDKVLDTYDAAQNRIKGIFLGQSLSWLKNNYIGNIGNAMIANGLVAGMKDASVFPNILKELQRDMWNIGGGKLHKKLIKDPLTKLMVKEGLIGHTAFDELGEKSAEFFFTGERKSRGYKPIMGALKAHEIASMPIEKAAFRVGGYIEDAAKAMTFKRVFEAAKQSGFSDAVASKMSANVVRETFFDYSRVHDVENAVMKRLMPFYTYYSRNAMMWAKVAEAPEGLTRLRMINQAWQQMGRSPSNEEREGLPRYMERGTRVATGDDDGSMEVYSLPNIPLFDVQSLGDPEDTRQKISPLLKTPYEFVTGEDTFMGGPYLPSEMVYETKKDGQTQGRRSLGSRGYTRAWVEKQLSDRNVPEWVRQGLGVAGTYVDEDKGKAYGSDDTSERMAKLWGLVVPPAVWQLGAPAIKQRMGDDAGSERDIMNLLMPWRTDRLTEEQMEMNKRFRKDR